MKKQVFIYYFDGEKQVLEFSKKIPSLSEIQYHTRGLKEIERIETSTGILFQSKSNSNSSDREKNAD